MGEEAWAKGATGVQKASCGCPCYVSVYSFIFYFFKVDISWSTPH